MLWLCLGLLLLQHITGYDTRVIKNLSKYYNFENYDNSLKPLRLKRQFDWDTARRQNFDPDSIIFNNNDQDFDNRNFVQTTRAPPANTPSSATTIAIPGMGTPRTPCEDVCPATPEYNPVCGSDNMTYSNRARFKCALKCGKRVNILHLGACTRRQG